MGQGAWEGTWLFDSTIVVLTIRNEGRDRRYLVPVIHCAEAHGGLRVLL